jgi:rhodanese-related sulfurtransferase
MLCEPDALESVGQRTLLTRARRGEVVVIDVRPEAEFREAHLPYARSVPLTELARRLSELPRDKEIVAYCRGPFCLMSDEAVTLLRRRGYRARQLREGVSEWQSAGLPLRRAHSAPSADRPAMREAP